MATFFPPAPSVIPGLVLPSIQYLNAADVPTTLNFLRPPRSVTPPSLDPVGSDTVASDGTLWSMYLYSEAYLSFKQTIYAGQDLLNWLDFLTNAGTGQVMTFTPNQAAPGTNCQVRLIHQGRQNNSSQSGAMPSGDPKPKRVSIYRYEADVVLRLESPGVAPTIYAKLVGLT